MTEDDHIHPRLLCPRPGINGPFQREEGQHAATIRQQQLVGDGLDLAGLNPFDTGHYRHRDAELFRNMTRKGVHIFDYVVKTLCRAAISWRASMTARVPGEDRSIVEA